ncbi:MAG: RluA family pseudouridine synthase [Hyphomicrobium sp.]
MAVSPHPSSLLSCSSFVEANEMSSGPKVQRITVRAGSNDAGHRIDSWLSTKIPDLSRSRVQALIKGGCVEAVSGATIGDVRSPVKPGTTYAVSVPEPSAFDVGGEAIALNIVHEDADVVVLDKPPGLVVHPGAGHASGTLVNALIAHCGDSLSGIGGVRRPGIVHRLDKDTSGLMVVAKNDQAHADLSEQFKVHGRDGRLHRAYLALAWGAPIRARGTIDAPLSRSAANRTKVAIVPRSAGRQAVTHFEIIESFADRHGVKGVASLVRLILETGRTHQIRVHLAHIGHPILGDASYGAGFRTRIDRLQSPAREEVELLARQALHAAELGFHHPRSGKKMSFVSDLPSDLRTVLNSLQASSGNLPPTEMRVRRRSKDR